jgi:hypothetical protein
LLLDLSRQSGLGVPFFEVLVHPRLVLHAACRDKVPDLLAPVMTRDWLLLLATAAIDPNAAICHCHNDHCHNDGPTPCEEANRQIFMDSGFNVSYILPFG